MRLKLPVFLSLFLVLRTAGGGIPARGGASCLTSTSVQV